MKRCCFQHIQEDLKTKAVAISGPRQAGKTTLSRMLLQEVEVGENLNWDIQEDRKAINEKKVEA